MIDCVLLCVVVRADQRLHPRHRDLKANNIFIASKNILKIGARAVPVCHTRH